MNNPFVTLCKTNSQKNIDNNFVQTLDAMLFLNSKDIHSKINEKFSYELLINVDKKLDRTPWLQEKIANETAVKIEENTYDSEDDIKYTGFHLAQPNAIYKHQQKYPNAFNKDTYSIRENIHIGSFLINKLSENFRRLYSANKNGGRVPKEFGSTIDSLKEQQINIYKSLKLISPYIKFDNELRTFENIFFGKVRHCSEAQAFYYLAMHEYLQSENEITHKELFKQNFHVANINSSIIQDVASLSYPSKKNKFIQGMIELMPKSFFEEMNIYLTTQYRASGSFMAGCFMHCVDNNIPLSSEAKLFILRNLLEQHSHWGKLPVEMAQPLVKKIENYISDVPLDCSKLQLINPGLIYKNCAATMCLLLTNKLCDPDIFCSSLNSNVEPQQQAVVFSKFDFSDQELILKIAKKINSYSASYKKEKMPQFTSIVGDYMENETLANILALDTSFIEFIQPLYMAKRLENELSQNHSQLNTNSSHAKRMKL
jgi:hypothetical protein